MPVPLVTPSGVATRFWLLSFFGEGAFCLLFWATPAGVGGGSHLRVRPKGFPLALWKPSESPIYTAEAREGLPLGTGK